MGKNIQVHFIYLQIFLVEICSLAFGTRGSRQNLVSYSACILKGLFLRPLKHKIFTKCEDN